MVQVKEFKLQRHKFSAARGCCVGVERFLVQLKEPFAPAKCTQNIVCLIGTPNQVERRGDGLSGC